MADQNYLVHMTTSGERWDHIAYKYYGDATKTAILLKANRHLWLEDFAPIPLIFTKSTEIRVPVIEDETFSDDQLPPWKRT